ncbi:hypothetical protein OsJ_24084 [Oryza sativa Japonica Group]|uniref:Uncharacterized protein n=1 Tax=Oryza sativa subsp. japonica TaxID=39947 RepID=A3BJB7_ORYSJ|nr:hypothetical protein OsJ_24084 [Oryza sativa Japonica Group]
MRIKPVLDGHPMIQPGLQRLHINQSFINQSFNIPSLLAVAMRGVVGVDGGEEELPLATAVGGVDGRGAGPWGAWTVGARPRRAAGGEDGRGAAAQNPRGPPPRAPKGQGARTAGPRRPKPKNPERPPNL